jgi:hypothetical protein
MEVAGELVDSDARRLVDAARPAGDQTAACVTFLHYQCDRYRL